MSGLSRQSVMSQPSNLDYDLAEGAFALFQKTYDWRTPIRKIGISGFNLMLDSTPYQITLWQNANRHEKRVNLAAAVDSCNKRWPHSIKPAIVMFEGHGEEQATKDLQRKFTPIGWLKGG